LRDIKVVFIFKPVKKAILRPREAYQPYVFPIKNFVDIGNGFLKKGH
jgi:hypothetical protein